MMPTEITIATTDEKLVRRLMANHEQPVALFEGDFKIVRWVGPESINAFHRIELRSLDPVNKAKTNV